MHVTPLSGGPDTPELQQGYPFIESPGKLLKDTIRTSGRLVGACVMPVVMRVSEHLSPSSARTSESMFRFVPLQQQEQKKKQTHPLTRGRVTFGNGNRSHAHTRCSCCVFESKRRIIFHNHQTFKVFCFVCVLERFPLSVYYAERWSNCYGCVSHAYPAVRGQKHSKSEHPPLYPSWHPTGRRQQHTKWLMKFNSARTES